MGLRLLVVEDEPAIADFLVRGLREEGYSVAHAADGDSARHCAAIRRLGPGAPGLVAAGRGRPSCSQAAFAPRAASLRFCS